MLVHRIQARECIDQLRKDEILLQNTKKIKSDVII